ncbi:uncharacterized protein [Dermacentor albipictus]|uniref:uncharacterized protein n=1 Tax=Dermacentor albipictus TaxID=60249 RepID=UPI0038FD3BF0
MEVVQVEGTDIRPEDFGKGAGWCDVKRKKQADGATESAHNQHVHMQPRTVATSTTGVTTAKYKRKYARQVKQVAMASRMPELPPDDCKIVVRPRGGFNVRDYGTDRIYCCLRNAAGVGREAAGEDSICLNVKQNVVVLSTPSEDRAKRYGAISKLCIGDREFEANSYQAAPENTSKGLIRNISKSESPADIIANLVTQRNPGVLHAKRMSNTDNIIVLFDGFHVPRYVYYGSMLVRCSLYRKQIDVCYECGRLGHRADVCPNPNDKICRGCGRNNPSPDHQCEPRCRLCGKGHFTGDRRCKARYKTPYVVKRRQIERKRQEEEEAATAYGSGYNSSSDCNGNDSYYLNFPKIDRHSVTDNRRGRSTSRGGKGRAGKSRSRSRSRNRAQRPGSTSMTRGGGGPGTAAVGHINQQSQQQQPWQQQVHRSAGQQVSWAAVAASPGGGGASAGRSGGPAVGGGGGNELERAIERVLKQRLEPLELIIAELKRENALLREENIKLNGEAPQPQQPSQRQTTMPPTSAPRSPTPSRPEPAGMDTDNEGSSRETADERDDRPVTAKRIALDPARPDSKQGCGRYEKLQKRVDNIEKSLEERLPSGSRWRLSV